MGLRLPLALPAVTWEVPAGTSAALLETSLLPAPIPVVY